MKTKIVIVALTFFSFFSCSKNENELKIINSILEDESSYFYTNLDPYKKKDAKLPIGIFDSGTGGLTVFDAIVNFDKYRNTDRKYLQNGDSIKDFNEECFIYLADQANMPYGNYGAHKKSGLLKEHVLKDAQFLLDSKYYESGTNEVFKNDKSPIKAMVIACNTATAYAKEEIEELIQKAGLNLKVIGVIGAGVRSALSQIKSNENVSVAIMATAGTVSSNGYVNEINKQLAERNNSGEIFIYQQAGIGIAGAIDEAIEYIDQTETKPRNLYKGPSDVNKDLQINLKILNRYNFDWSDNNILYNGTIENPVKIQLNSVKNYINYHVTSLLEQMVKSEKKSKLKSIVLGCTHYPFYTDFFNKQIEFLRNYSEEGNFVYSDFLSDKIDFIDPALFTAKELYDYLAKEELFNNNDISNSEFYISVPNYSNKNTFIDESGNFEYDYKYGRKVNEIQQYVKRVPFSKKTISKNVLERLSQKIPFTYSLIQEFNSTNPKTKYLNRDFRIE